MKYIVKINHHHVKTIKQFLKTINYNQYFSQLGESLESYWLHLSIPLHLSCPSLKTLNETITFLMHSSLRSTSKMYYCRIGVLLAIFNLSFEIFCMKFPQRTDDGKNLNLFVSFLCTCVAHTKSLAIIFVLQYKMSFQITVGVYGHEEEVLDKPVSPNEIRNLLFSKCMPHNPFEAVLQQEIILSIGKLIATAPELFDGILKIRIG